MRIVRLFPFACAAFMMSACASENDDKGGDTNAEGKAQYMAVNIVSVGTNGSRAAAEYDDGLEKESKIKDVRFYFYNQDGSPYILDGPNTNWTKPLENISNGQQNTNDENITLETNSVLVFKSATGNSAPYSVIAVVNAESLGNSQTNPLGEGTQNLNSLLTTIEGKQFYKVNIPTGSTAPTTNYDKAVSAENFVMTSSVYLKDGEPQCQTLVSGHVYNKEDEAKKDPIDIYVERVVAKVTAEVNHTTVSKWELGNDNNWDSKKYGKVVGQTTDGKDVYAVLDGWNVADENGTAMLEKNIDKTWTDTGLGFTSSDPWYSADYHRCFWENSTEAGTAENPSINYSYTTIANNAFGADKYVYTLPNTLKSKITKENKYNNKLTKFIVAAHLRHYNDGKGKWENVEICNYKGIQYIGQDAVLDVIGNESEYYIQESAGKYKSIGHEQLEFIKATTTNAKDYKAMAKVKDGVNVYHKDNTTGKYEPVTSLEEINNRIQAETADVRADGSTYYFIPISHLGSDASIAQYGVVRNHVYKITVNDMQGFGTPVVNKDAEIIPTKPENEATYLAAKIKVLSWRIVKQNADLDYSK